MAVYSKSDLNSAKAYISVLKNDISDITKLSNAIQDFCNDSPKYLQGDSWNLIRTNLNDYINILNLRKNVLNDLINQIDSVNNKLLLAMGNYSEINTDHLDEQQQIYNQCKNDIANLKRTANYDKNTEQHYNYMMHEADKMINQINEVKRVEASSMSSLEQVANDLINYSSRVDEIPIPVISYTEAI